MMYPMFLMMVALAAGMFSIRKTSRPFNLFQCFLFALMFLGVSAMAADVAVAISGTAGVNPGGEVLKKILDAGSVLNVNTAAGTVGLFVWLEGMFMGWAPVWLRPLLPSIFSLIYWAVTGYTEGMPVAKIVTGAFATSAGSMLIHDGKDWVMKELPGFVGNLLQVGKPGPVSIDTLAGWKAKGDARYHMYNDDGSVKG